jgi:hypothetical protein
MTWRENQQVSIWNYIRYPGKDDQFTKMIKTAKRITFRAPSLQIQLKEGVLAGAWSAFQHPDFSF